MVCSYMKGIRVQSFRQSSSVLPDQNRGCRPITWSADSDTDLRICPVQAVLRPTGFHLARAASTLASTEC